MSRSATILLVEDDNAILDGMADLLDLFDLDYDISVLKASDGAEGLRVMEEATETPDLIISDIMMPRLNGFEFLTAVRRDPAWVHIPFIFLTAKGNKEDILEGRRSGAELYITKPFVSEELLELVKSQLDRTFELQNVRQQQLDSLKRNVLQLLNHEFRTPLTYVTAYYEMLADSLINVEDPATLQEYLRGIQVGSQRLTKLVEDLITVMEIRTGEAAAAYEAEAHPLPNVGNQLRERGKKHEARAAERGITFRYQIEEDLPPVYGNPALLGDSLDRLIDNAIKFTQARSDGPREITLEANATSDRVFLSVADSGVGFPPHVGDQLFDLFFQYNRETLEQQGSGTGLAIAKDLVRLHHGYIAVESKVGAGSKFTVVLPVHQPGATSAVSNEQAPRTATVLLVEDDPHLLEGLKELLIYSNTRYKLNVITAENGQEGLNALRQQRPDLIISDVMMPIMGGYQFLRRVRDNAAWLQIPFIFLTAKGEREDIHRGRRSGAEEYITKPYDIDELLDLTVTQLDRHFQRQGALNQNFEELKRSILSMLQPDFKGSLSLVTSYSQKLASGLANVETDEDLINSLHGIQASSERLSRFVEDFIAMAEFKTGEAATAFSMRAAPVDNVSMLLYEAAYDKQYKAQKKNVTFTYELEHDLPPVICDREQLVNAFKRLIEIVLLACLSEPPTQVRFASEAAGNHVSLSISCRRSLLSAGIIRRIATFLEKEEEEMMELPNYGPTLTVVKNAILLHEGQICLRRQEESDFYFHITLPVHQPGSKSVSAR